jgi:hypothetical protein
VWSDSATAPQAGWDAAQLRLSAIDEHGATIFVEEETCRLFSIILSPAILVHNPRF